MRECQLLRPGDVACTDYGDEAEQCETRCYASASCETLKLSACGFGMGNLGICTGSCVGLAPVTCSDGRQISGYARCNLAMDCPNGEDEIGCTSEMTAKFKCRNVDEFVSTAVICDGRRDCSDGSDEGSGCEIVLTCGGINIQARQVCNGLSDCLDNSDEPATCAKVCP